jgi:hypothetical protein
MYRLRCLRLENIGHSAAGFKSLILDLTGGASRVDGMAMSAVDVILWLRNGGGKSSLLSLFFSLFLPAKIDFIGHKQEKSLADYVPDAKASHVIAEWENTSLSRGGPALITGGVYQWQDGHRPADPAAEWERLVRRWYALRPLPGVLDLESLPIRTAGGQLTQDAYLKALVTAHQGQRGLELRIARDQSEWERVLTGARLDPGVLRIQRNMNREEGGITQLFQFSSCEDFINFLIDLVCEMTEPNLVRASLAEQADRLAARPSRETEQRFLAAAVLALKPVQEDSARAAAREADVVQQAGVAWRAAEHLHRRADELDASAAQAAQQAEDAQTQAEQARARTAQQERRVTVLTQQAAHWAVVEADEHVRACEQAESAATVTLRAWEVVEPLVELAARRQEDQELRERLTRQDAQQAPLREAAESAGAALRDKLTGAIAELACAADEAETSYRAAAAEAAASEAGRAQATEATGQAKARLRQAAQTLSAGQERLTAARQRGLVGPSEDPGEALHRWESGHTQAEEQLARCHVRLADALQQLSHLADQQRTTAVQLAAAREQHGAQWDRLDQLHAENRALAADPRLLELACAQEGTVLDMDHVAGDLLNLLAEAGQQADAQLLKEQQEAAEDQRAAHALDQEGFLPPPAEVEHAVQRLHAQDVPAVPGLQFLREAFPAHRHEEIIAAVPHLVGGVVVCGPVPGADLAARVRKAGVSRAVITVSTEEQAQQAAASPDGLKSLVLAVHPAVLEPDAAQREQERLRHRLAGAEERKRVLVHRRKKDDALAHRLQAHLDVFGPQTRAALEEGTARLEAQVEALHSKERLLNEQATDLRQQADGAREESERLASQLADGASQLAQVRQLAAQHAELPAFQQAAQQAQQDLAEHQAAVRRHARQYTAAAGREQAGREQHRRQRERLRRWREEVQQLAAALPESCAHTLSAAQLAASPVQSLRERYEQARRDWQNEIGDDELRARAHACAERITALAGSLPATGTAARERAEELARSPRAGDADERARARAEAGTAQRAALEEVGAAKHTKKQACAAQEAARAAVEALDPPWDGSEKPGGPFNAAAEAHTERAAVQASLLRAQQEGHALQLTASELGTVTEKARNAAHGVSRCAQAMTAAAQRCGIGPGNTPGAAEAARLDAWLLELLEGSGALASLSPAQAESMEQAVISGVEKALENRERAHKQLEKSLRKVQLLAQDASYTQVVDGQLRERLQADLAHPVRLAELIDDIDLREKTVLEELAGLAEDHLMVVQACVELVKTTLDDLKEVAQHSRLPLGLGSWSGQPFLSLEIRHVPDDEVLARRVSAQIDQMIDAVASQPSTARASALPTAMALVKELVLAALGGRGNVVAKIIKPTQSLDTIQRDSVTEIKKFSGGELLTVSVLLYCTLARLRAAKQGRKGAGGVGTLVLDNPFGKSNYAPFISLQRRVAQAHGIQLVYTTGSNDLPALERFPLIIRLRNGTDARTRAQYVQIAGRYGDAVSRGLQHAHGTGITSARLHRPDGEESSAPDQRGTDIPRQGSQPQPADGEPS